MKKLILAGLILIFSSLESFSQTGTTELRTLKVNGINRTYRIYIPDSYNGNVKVPLLFNLHGKTSSAQEQEQYGSFRKISDEQNFLLVHPQGLPDNSGVNTWNVNDSEQNPSDIKFISKLIDVLAIEFNINTNRVYLAGLSFGGTMSYKLACELSEKITAIACVSGAMNFNQKAVCNPTHIMPVMQIQGTADPIIPFDGSSSFMSMNQIVNYWSGIDQCDSPSPDVYNVPNLVSNDQSTAKRNVYKNGNYGVVELYKVLGGGHSWPGSPIYIDVTNQDFSASEVIWNFLKQFKLNHLGFSNPGMMVNDEDEFETSELAEGKQKSNIDNKNAYITTYPNPFTNEVLIQTEGLQSNAFITVTNLLGQVVELESNTTVNNQLNINTSNWKQGIYIVSVNNNGNITHKKIMKK
jgi:polyhydroxybutyrate depolymerase